jgi:ParB family transcriptional regulator, chromosome partitioning protein
MESAIERTEVDPRTLLVDTNVRNDVRLDDDFVASIKELGVLVPITAVRTSAGEIRVRFGHRRTLAAIDAGRTSVPVEIIGTEGEDDAAQVERIITQHAENVHRAGLTASEKVDVVAQLSAFGVPAGEISKKTRIQATDVAAAVTVAKSELAKAAADRYEYLTLEQAAAVAEFEGDNGAVKRLIIAANGNGNFEYTLQTLREDRQGTIEQAKREEELRGQGTNVIAYADFRSDHSMKALTEIRRYQPDLTDQAHESCPGRAVFVDAYMDEEDSLENRTVWFTEDTEVCTDPVEYGHLKAATPAGSQQVQGDTSVQDRIDEEARQERR